MIAVIIYAACAVMEFAFFRMAREKVTKGLFLTASISCALSCDFTLDIEKGGMTY